MHNGRLYYSTLYLVEKSARDGSREPHLLYGQGHYPNESRLCVIFYQDMQQRLADSIMHRPDND